MTTLEDRTARLEALVESQAAVIAKLEALVKSQSAIIAAKDATIERLEARVAELEQRLAERDGKPPQSPPSSRTPARVPSGRAAGAQPGHKGTKRTLIPASQVTRIIECFPDSCRSCGKALKKKVDAEPVVHQVVDLPPITPDVTEFRRHHVTCSCGVTTCAEIPEARPRG